MCPAGDRHEIHGMTAVLLRPVHSAMHAKTFTPALADSGCMGCWSNVISVAMGVGSHFQKKDIT